MGGGSVPRGGGSGIGGRAGLLDSSGGVAVWGRMEWAIEAQAVGRT